MGIDEEYLTTDQLCERIQYRKQTIYNMIYNGDLIQGKHFLKPTPKKLLFKWSEMEVWLGEVPVPEVERKTISNSSLGATVTKEALNPPMSGKGSARHGGDAKSLIHI